MYYKTLIFVLFVSSFIACGRNKPTEADDSQNFPKANYERITPASFPFSFEKSMISVVKTYKDEKKRYWFDLGYPQFNAKIYFSYKPIENQNLYSLLQETREMAYRHKVRADAIFEKTYENQDKSVYGIVYELTGNTASNLQFVLTDKTKHFVRAALYFDATPNPDSIAPIAKYIKKDMVHLIETFEWQKND